MTSTSYPPSLGYISPESQGAEMAQAPFPFAAWCGGGAGTGSGATAHPPKAARSPPCHPEAVPPCWGSAGVIASCI